MVSGYINRDQGLAGRGATDTGSEHWESGRRGVNYDHKPLQMSGYSPPREGHTEPPIPAKDGKCLNPVIALSFALHIIACRLRISHGSQLDRCVNAAVTSYQLTNCPIGYGKVTDKVILKSAIHLTRLVAVPCTISPCVMRRDNNTAHLMRPGNINKAHTAPGYLS